MSIPVDIRFLGLSRSHRPVKVETRDISVEGLAIQLEVIFEDGISLVHNRQTRVKLIPFLVLNEKLVDLTIEIPPEGESIKAIGRVIWYDFYSMDASYYLMVGIFLEEMETQDRKRWGDFVRNIAED